MIEGMLCILIAGLMWCGIGIVLSSIVRDNTPILPFLAATYLVGVALAWLIVPDYSALGTYTSADLLILGATIVMAGVSVAGGMYCSTVAMRRGQHGTAWSITQSALVVPFLVSVLFFDDRASVFSVLGVLLVVCGIGAIGRDSNRNEESKSSRAFAWALAAFCLVGIQQTLTLVPSRVFEIADPARLRVPLMGTGLLLGYGLAAMGRGGFRFEKPGRILLMVFFYISSQFVLFRAIDIFSQTARTAYIYPWAISINIAAFILYTLVFHKEKLNRLQVIALICIITGILLTP